MSAPSAPRPYPLPHCRYYGHNQCGLVTDSHAPCYLEIAGHAPDELACDLVLLATLQAIADAAESE